MISPAQNALIRKCRLSAMVVSRAADNQTRLFWLTETNPEAELTALLDAGFSSVGLLGFDGSGLHLEPETDAPDTLRLLKLAAGDFMLAALAMKAGARRN